MGPSPSVLVLLRSTPAARFFSFLFFNSRLCKAQFYTLLMPFFSPASNSSLFFSLPFHTICLNIWGENHFFGKSVTSSSKQLLQSDLRPIFNTFLLNARSGTVNLLISHNRNGSTRNDTARHSICARFRWYTRKLSYWMGWNVYLLFMCSYRHIQPKSAYHRPTLIKPTLSLPIRFSPAPFFSDFQEAPVICAQYRIKWCAIWLRVWNANSTLAEKQSKNTTSNVFNSNFSNLKWPHNRWGSIEIVG